MHRVEYRTPAGQRGVCGVRVISVDATKKIVILTELADNPGSSVTNSWPFIASSVYYQLFREVDPKGIAWVEHYGQQSYRHPHSDGDRYDLVELEWDDTQHEYSMAKDRHPWRPAPEILVNHFNQLLRRAS